MFVDESNVLFVYQSVIKMYLNVYDHYCVLYVDMLVFCSSCFICSFWAIHNIEMDICTILKWIYVRVCRFSELITKLLSFFGNKLCTLKQAVYLQKNSTA